MKITPTCVPCLIKRIIFEADQSTNDRKKKTKVIRLACQLLGKDYDPTKVSAHVATRIHRQVYDLLGTDDPYADLKEKSNRLALSLLPRVDELIKQADDPLQMSMICSIVGNTLDFGIDGASKDPNELTALLESSVKEGLGYDDTATLKNILAKSKRVLLFTDNCGEIVFDKLLCRELKLFNPDLTISLVVKGEPVLSDATMKDAVNLGFENVVDELFTTGCFAVGVDFSELPPKVSERLHQTDLIICKGMANFESFSETTYAPIAYLLRTKCQPIADAMQVPVDKNIIKVYP